MGRVGPRSFGSLRQRTWGEDVEDDREGCLAVSVTQPVRATTIRAKTIRRGTMTAF